MSSGENCPVSSLIPGTIMLESGKEVTIDIDATVSCKSSSNTLEITLKRDREVLLMGKRDGSMEIIGSSIAPPFSISHILLNHIVSFDPHNIHPLLNSTLQDHILCDHLTVEIASQAVRVPGTLYISLHVTVTPHRCLGHEPDKEEETCSICLRDLYSSGEIYTYLPDCYHDFHDNCIETWLRKNNTCPLCRTVVRDIDDD